MIFIIAAIIIMIPVNNVMINILMMMNIYAHWEHNIYLWFKMSDRKMSDMIDAHSGFFQTVTSIHTMAADLTVSDKHIWLLHIFSIFHATVLLCYSQHTFSLHPYIFPSYFIFTLTQHGTIRVVILDPIQSKSDFRQN